MRPWKHKGSCHRKYNFNPRTSCEVRLGQDPKQLQILVFQSTHLVWGATLNAHAAFRGVQFQSTHLVWGATQTRLLAFMELYISIHAPRVRCDMAEIRGGSFSSTISIHAPRVRCDFLVDAFKAANDNIFQSTHLVWGATTSPYPPSISSPYFNPRTSCEVRLSHRPSD